MVRKSDGGYGYGTTDMAAITQRVRQEKADWIIYVTDAGQAGHFKLVPHIKSPPPLILSALPAHNAQMSHMHATYDMCRIHAACGHACSTAFHLKGHRSCRRQVFASARRAGILPAEADGQPRVSHVGFGLVLGEDGKRFRTRASEVPPMCRLHIMPSE